MCATTGPQATAPRRPSGSVTRPTARASTRNATCDFRGILQADACGGWNALYNAGHVGEAACWAHARRPWWDLYEQHRDDTGLAAQALRHIQGLYAVEADVRGHAPEVRREQRQARAGHLLEAFHR